mmetsp:Transcript_17977/g.46459  ORF Transcript_17977/g.46459 Transcript_17977/m.46459 type:complete len:316 (-) Transcript_17977:372-1319(-)
MTARAICAAGRSRGCVTCSRPWHMTCPADQLSCHSSWDDVLRGTADDSLGALLDGEKRCRSTIRTEMLSPEPRRSARLHSAFAPSSEDEHLLSTWPQAGSFTTSHSPSDARIRYASVGAMTKRVISGSAHTPYRFRWRSPNARDTARSPATRQQPWCTTQPPAAHTRAFSSGLFGLWSLLSAMQLPSLRTRAHRESPTLATVSTPLRCSTAAMAVEPSESPSLAAPRMNASSACRKPSRIDLCRTCSCEPSSGGWASPTAMFCSSECTMRVTRCLCTYCAASLPPCPSYTAKKLMRPMASAVMEWTAVLLPLPPV